VTRAGAKRERQLKRAEKAGATLKPISETVVAEPAPAEAAALPEPKPEPLPEAKPAPPPDPLEFPQDDDSPG